MCFEGASDDQIAVCEVEVDPDNLESELLDELGDRGNTLVAFALEWDKNGGRAGIRTPDPLGVNEVL